MRCTKGANGNFNWQANNKSRCNDNIWQCSFRSAFAPTNDKGEALPPTKFQICIQWVLKKFKTLEIYSWKNKSFWYRLLLKYNESLTCF